MVNQWKLWESFVVSWLICYWTHRKLAKVGLLTLSMIAITITIVSVFENSTLGEYNKKCTVSENWKAWAPCFFQIFIVYLFILV